MPWVQPQKDKKQKKKVKKIKTIGNIFHLNGLEDSIFLRCQYDPKCSKIHAIPVKIPMTFLRKRKANPKIHIDSQGTLKSQNNLGKSEKTWRTHTS